MRTVTLSTLVLASLLVASPAAGKDRKAQAKQLAQKGTALFNAGKYDEAIVAFEQAYELRPHYLVQCNIARCHELRGAMEQAAAHYRRCLQEGGESAPQEARTALTEVEKRLREKEERENPPPPPPPPQPPPAKVRQWFATAGLGPAIELMNLDSQLKLEVSFGCHLLRRDSGPAIALDVQVGVTGGFVSIELGPRFLWDIPIVPAYGLFLTPTVLVGFSHLTAPTCSTKTGCPYAASGLTAQLGIEARMLLVNRVIVYLRPLTLDIVPVAEESRAFGLRYDLMAGAGVVF